MMPILQPMWFTRKFFRMFGSLYCCFVFDFLWLFLIFCNLPAHFCECALLGIVACVCLTLYWSFNYVIFGYVLTLYF